MSTPTPPAKARHLRLVPPEAATPAWPTDADLPALTSQPLRHVGALPRARRLSAAVMGLTLAAWSTATWWAPRGGRRAPAAPAPAKAAAEAGPTFAAYARQGDGEEMGRQLAEGDRLQPEDHLILAIHNAPGSGAEAAQYAAVFAMDADRHVATLYPTDGDAAWAMPLPQVAALALLDGPQLSVSQGPITLVTLFLRAPVALATAREALRLAANSPQAGEAALTGLGRSLVRLQRLTLVGPEAQQSGAFAVLPAANPDVGPAGRPAP